MKLDIRDAAYFINLLQRREEAITEYSIVSKAIQKERLKNSQAFANPANKELFDKFDCMPTPNMSDFDIVHWDKVGLTTIVKKLCSDRKFRCILKYTAKKDHSHIKFLKFTCSESPYFETKVKQTESCPFHVIYRYDEDEEEFYLDCFDEMHNHVLCHDPRILPYSKKNVIKPTFETPSFVQFQVVKSNNFADFKNKII